MKAQDFRGFIEQLGDLTEVQRSALAAALAGKGSGNEAIALIEMQFSAAPACGHCKSERFGSWGHASGLRRYKCRDCHRTFNALTGTPLAQLHRRDAWLAYARALVDRVSLRKAAKRAGIGLEASFRWRHRFLKAARDKRPSVVTGIVEADETLILKSWKGSKRLMACCLRGKPRRQSRGRPESAAGSRKSWGRHPATTT
jgi:transposase-like protein